MLIPLGGGDEQRHAPEISRTRTLTEHRTGLVRAKFAAVCCEGAAVDGPLHRAKPTCGIITQLASRKTHILGFDRVRTTRDFSRCIESPAENGMFQCSCRGVTRYV